MRQRREDIRNIALIVGSGCLGALAVGIGLTAATSVDVDDSRFTVDEVELHPVEVHTVRRGNRSVSISIQGSARKPEGLAEAREKAVQAALEDLEAQLDRAATALTELEASKVRVEADGHRMFSRGFVRIGGTAGADPMVYVDGVRFEDGLEGLDPDEIDSIEILKGDKATEQYGEEGAKGVIIIVTRTGKKRKGGGGR